MRRVGALKSIVLGLLAVAIGFAIATGVSGGLQHSPPSTRRLHASGRRARLARAAAPPPAPHTVPAPHTAPVPRAAPLPPIVTGGLPRHRLVALTFDDGPGPYTAQVIAQLTRLHVPATFFVVGQQLVDFGSELRAELAHGFVVGDHTENHAWLVRLDEAAQYRQIDDALLRLHHLQAPRPTLFRPPYGSMNRTTFTVLARLHLTAVLWSVDPSDWARPGTAAIAARVLERARPGAIVLLHDGGGQRAETVAALPLIVSGLRRRGYTLVTVPRLLALDPPPAHPHLPSFVSDR